MQPPPSNPDPNAFTQPMPVTPGPPPPGPPGGGPPPGGRPPPFDHRFGKVPSYLFARLLAFAFDIGVVAFVFAAFGYDAFERGLILFATRDQQGFELLALAALGSALAVTFTFEALAGTTVGKLIFGLHVRNSRGGHAGIGRAFVRNLIRPIDVLAVGPLLALITPRHQRLGDLLAGTVVGRSPMGAFATVLGVILAAGIGFVQATFGGGMTSALGVTAEAALFVPQLYSSVTGPGGAVAPFIPGARLPSPRATVAAPSPAASPEPEVTPEARVSPQASESPGAAPSPEEEASPGEAPTEEPSPDEHPTANV